MTEHELDVLEEKYLKRQRDIMSPFSERRDTRVDAELLQSFPALLQAARDALVGVVR